MKTSRLVSFIQLAFHAVVLIMCLESFPEHSENHTRDLRVNIGTDKTKLSMKRQQEKYVTILLIKFV